MAKKDETKIGGISVDNLVVADPQVLRPTELPLVITPPEGQDWLNPEQAEYAKILNAAAYTNKLWAVPQKNETGEDIPSSSIRDVEIRRLVEIGTNPDKFYVYTGTVKGQDTGTLTYKNKLLE